MNLKPWIFGAFAFLAAGPSAPGAPQEEFLDFIRLAEQLESDMKSVEKETDHFVISAPRSAAEVMAPHAETLWNFFAETLGVSPKDRIKIEFYLSRRQFAKEVAPGTYERYDPEAGVLHFLFDYDWRRDLARGIAEAFLHKLAPERAAAMPPALKYGLKVYLGNYDGRMDATAFHTPATGHLHIARRAQVMCSRGKLVEGKKLEDLKAEEVPGFEPGTWALAGYLMNAKGRRDALKTWLAAYVEGKDPGPIIPTPGELARWVSSIEAKVPDREEGKYLVGETQFYTIYVQKGTARKKPAMTDKQILEDLKKRMDLIFVKYALAFKVEAFNPRRPKVYYYKDEGSYIGAGGSSQTLAHYLPISKTVVAYENPEGKVVTTFHVLAHEGCHQFFDLSFPGFYGAEDTPTWFSEGLAECFGSCEIRGSDLVIFTMSGSAAENAPIIREVVKQGKAASLKDLLEVDHGNFMRNAQILYPQSWSVCHFLWNAGYKEVLVRLIEGFKRGRPRDEVYKEAFKRDGKTIDLDSLDREWTEYVKRLK
ncbi:MAG TPA: DUF1570 domain-containing protein [Planctomycetota bacterium]|nr:DUF1570 domain-containing protein [Planctomycetota bacterium]